MLVFIILMRIVNIMWISKKELLHKYKDIIVKVFENPETSIPGVKGGRGIEAN